MKRFLRVIFLEKIDGAIWAKRDALFPDVDAVVAIFCIAIPFWTQGVRGSAQWRRRMTRERIPRIGIVQDGGKLISGYGEQLLTMAFPLRICGVNVAD